MSLGYEGSYGRVAAFARAWKEERQHQMQTSGRGPFVPLAFEPGEAFQFDWSEDWAIIGGERAKLQVAHFKLSYSRAFIVRAYPLQTHEMLFDAHNHNLELRMFAPPCWPSDFVRGAGGLHDDLLIGGTEWLRETGESGLDEPWFKDGPRGRAVRIEYPGHSQRLQCRGDASGSHAFPDDVQGTEGNLPESGVLDD